MTQWIVLNEGWRLRPTQDGLELLNREKSIELQLENPKVERPVLESIFLGRKQIPYDAEIQAMLDMLAKESALTFSRHKPCTDYQEQTDTELVLWKLRRKLVGTRGPIYAVYWLNPSNSNFSSRNSHLFTARYLSTERKEGSQSNDWAFATNEDVNLAELKAVMEAVERYASGIVPQEELIKTSARELGEAAIDPRNIVAYSRSQYRQNFPLTQFSPNHEYYWKEVSTLPENKKHYLPVECVYYPIRTDLAPFPYTFTTSSGVAAGLNAEEAITRGLYEAVERDAFMIVWLNRLVMPRVDINSLPVDQQERAQHVKQFGYEIFFVDLTLDTAPIVLAAAVSYDRMPALVLGCAATSLLIEATSKALSEVEQQLYWNLRKDITLQAISDPKEVEGVLGHMALYASHEHLSKASFLWQGEAYPLTQHEPECFNILEALTSTGKEVITADLTSRDLNSSMVRVMRSIPKGFVPISFGYGMEPLGMPRIKSIPQQLGLPTHPLKHYKPFTHPFA